MPYVPDARSPDLITRALYDRIVVRIIVRIAGSGARIFVRGAETPYRDLVSCQSVGVLRG